jgi:hypothetical protein
MLASIEMPDDFGVLFEERPGSSTLFRMDLPMTTPTERDEIFFRIVAEPASGRNMVNFESRTRAARLATPTVPL